MRWLCLLLALLPMPAAAEDGFRGEPYVGATPAEVPGGRTVGFAEVQALRQAGALLIDVTPLSLSRVGAMAGRWVVPAPHETIAGAVWLPNVGLARLDEPLERWFRHHLGGDPGRPLVFFCKPDCWMSWNAAKRAAGWGYTAVHWYPDGVDGWRDGLGPVEWAAPEVLR